MDDVGRAIADILDLLLDDFCDSHTPSEYYDPATVLAPFVLAAINAAAQTASEYCYSERAIWLDAALSALRGTE
jgi:hypothetical protein